MQAVSIRVFLATIPVMSLFLAPLTALANDDWRSNHFYEKLTATTTAPYDLYSGTFSRVHDSYYYPPRRIDPRDRLYGGRHYYGHDYYGNGYYRHGWGHRPWYGRGYDRGGWNCPPRYGYDRNDYYRRHRSPW